MSLQMKLNTIRSCKTIYINKKPYIVYAFVIIDTDIKNLLKGLRHTKTSSYTSFIRFWGATDGLVNRYIVCPATLFNYEQHSVPETDFQFSLAEIRKEQNERRVP